MPNSTTTPHRHGKTLTVLDALLSKFEHAAAWMGALGLAALLALTMAEVVARNIFNKPIVGLVDMVEWCLPFAAVLGVAATQAAGEHIRMDIAVKAFGGRLRWLAEASATALALCFVTIVFVFGLRIAFRSFESKDIAADIPWLLWPPKFMIALAFGLLGLRLLLQTAGFARLILHPTVEPVAVPPQGNGPPLEETVA